MYMLSVSTGIVNAMDLCKSSTHLLDYSRDMPVGQ